MSKNSITQESDQPFIVAHPALVLSLAATVLICIFSSLWWSKVHDSPRQVFEGMLSNNLSTSSVTRQTIAGSDASVDKLEQLSFVSPIATRSLITISQPSAEGNSKVITETIGTLTTDYSRYLSIDSDQKGQTGKKLNYSSVENVWGASSPGQGAPQYHSQSILGLVPFGNLGTKAKDELIKKLLDDKAYTIDYAGVKPQKIGSKSALVFPVSIDAQKYIAILKTLAKSSGAGELEGLNPQDYAGQPPIAVTITVDKRSRHVIEVMYGQQKEVYSSYGLITSVQTPDKTIPVDELQKKVQEVK